MADMRYGMYVVRTWLEPDDGVGSAGSWRASVLDTFTNKKRFFARPEDLVAFLHHEGPNPTLLAGEQD